MLGNSRSILHTTTLRQALLALFTFPSLVCIIFAMSYRNIGFIVVSAVAACSLAAGCKELTIQENGTAGMGGMGGSGGAAGAAGMNSNSSSGGMPGDWWDPAWSHRTRITFQNADGETLTDFPVMIRLDTSRFPNAQASPVGADLRFIDADGKTVLPHEIDGWNPDGNSFVWVKVPTINATNTDHIWLYYGNPMASDMQNTATVWDSFIGVYHLSPSASTPTQFADSTGQAPGEWYNNMEGAIGPGPIHEAIDLNGVNFVHIGDNSNVAANSGQARTIEAWVNAKMMQQQQSIVHTEGQCVGWTLGTTANDEYRGSFITDSIMPLCGTGSVEYSVTKTPSAATWSYLTLVIDRPGLVMSLFVDGMPAGSTAIDNTNNADGNGVFRIGSDFDGGLETFIGAIDEVRVSSSARSAGWIAAQHKSMTDQFLVFQVE